MNNNSSALLGSIIGFIIIFCMLPLIIFIISIIVEIAGIGGILWGGGTAVINYAKSFKENIIDSN